VLRREKKVEKKSMIDSVFVKYREWNCDILGEGQLVREDI